MAAIRSSFTSRRHLTIDMRGIFMGKEGVSAGWPSPRFGHLSDAGTRGIAGVSRSCVSSCCFATQTLKAEFGSPRRYV